MSKINQLIQNHCPAGVEYKKLEDVLTIKNGRDYKQFGEGDVPVYGSGGIMTYINTAVYDKPSVLIPRKGSLDKLYYVDTPFWNVDTIFYTDIDTSLVEPKFIYYYLEGQHLERLNKAGGVPSLTQAVLNKVQLPVPPLEVQREIVRILDYFTLLTAELTAELTARKKQYEFYRDKLLTFSENKVKYLPLGELYPDIRNGFVGTVTPFFSNKENGVLYLRGTNVHDGVISNEDVVYVSKEFHEKHNRTELKSDDIIMVQSGHVGECAVVGEAYAGANCHALIVMSNGGKCNSKYIVYYFHSYEGRKKLDAITTGGTVKHILASKMKKVIVPIPPLEVQNRLVNVLDNLEAICTDLNIGLPAEIEVRQKQYEYYRDLLLTFAETGSTLLTDRQTDRQTCLLYTSPSPRD